MKAIAALNFHEPTPVQKEAIPQVLAGRDVQGVTAEFNKNILRVVNKELGTRFNPASFDHQAFFNENLSRIEMHLRANRGHTVNIRDLGVSVSLDKGESIRTEICRKFSWSAAKKMVEDVGIGMRVDRWHSDPRGWFSIAEIVGRSEGGAREI